MNFYIRVSDGQYPLTQQDIMQTHPNVAFPERFELDGYEFVFPTPVPQCAQLERVVEDMPILTGKGHWEQTWKIVDRFQDWPGGMTKEEQEEEYLAQEAEQYRQTVVFAVQDHMDKKAQKQGYDHMLSLCSYAASEHPVFGAEGRAGFAWRDQVWSKCHEILQAVKSGERPIPNMEEIISELPELK